MPGLIELAQSQTADIILRFRDIIYIDVAFPAITAFFCYHQHRLGFSAGEHQITVVVQFPVHREAAAADKHIPFYRQGNPRRDLKNSFTVSELKRGFFLNGCVLLHLLYGIHCDNGIMRALALRRLIVECRI